MMFVRNRLIFVSMFTSLATVCVFLLVLVLYLPTFASPESTFVVNSISDTDDGFCDGTHCSLREAINAANDAVGADTITFSLLPSATITLAGSQLPTISETLTIDGSTTQSLTVSGDNESTVFWVSNSATVTFTELTIADGSNYGIANIGGTLNLNEVIIADNFGHGIYTNGGILTISNSIFSGNRFYYTCDFIFCPSQLYGAAIYNNGGTVNITESTFSENLLRLFCDFNCTAPGQLYTAGGGIYNSGVMTVSDSIFSHNGAYIICDICYDSGAVRGGGIHNSGTLHISNSTVSGNGAGNYCKDCASGVASGGGIYNYGALHISNSTVSGNAAGFTCLVCDEGYARGGGITNNGTLSITNVTLNANSVSSSMSASGGGISNGGLLGLMNSIIANSISGDCSSGPISPNINNLIEDGSCPSTLTGDPLLGPLQDNGGPTWTHALTSPSPAVDAGDDSICAAPPVNNLDQRGVVRPLDGDGDGAAFCDIGAFEYDGPPPYRFYLPILRRI